MLGWLSSLFNGRSKLEISVDGSLIRYVYGKTPRTLSVDTTLRISPGLNEDEYVLKVEDNEWDLSKDAEFSIIENTQQIAAFCWNAEKKNVYNVFILNDVSKFQDVCKVASVMLYKSLYGEDPQDESGMYKLIPKISLPFNLETLQPLPEESTQAKEKTEPKRKSIYPSPEIEPVSEFADEKKLYSTKGDFFLLDVRTNTFHEKGVGFELSYIRIGKSSAFTSILAVTARDGQRVLATGINSTLNPQILVDQNAIVFTTLKPLATWGFIFRDQKEVEGKKLLVQLVWESQYMKDFTTLDEDDQAYILESYDEGRTDDKGYESDDYMDIVDSESDEESEEDEDVPRRRVSSKPSKAKSDSKDRNTLLVDSALHDRAFVLRGSQVGFFNDETADYLGKIDLKLRPKQMILHDKENKLLLAVEGKVKALDLVKEKVVAEYTDDSGNISKIGQVKKYAEQTGEPVFTAMSKNAIWGMDTRISGKSQSINKETYKTNPKFEVFSTSSSGQLAVGSEDGIVRLYTGVSGLPKATGTGTYPMRAKTNLPGFGDPIIGLDTSGDGKWVLATCERYLIVIPTEIDEKTGFEIRMGKNKPSPRRLQLLPDDIQRLGGKVSFTPAKFNTGADGETWIVTSTGNHVVTWNFRRVRKDCLTDYIIKSMHDDVSSDQFVSMSETEHGGSDAPIIVALDDDVVVEKRVRRKKNPFQSKPRF